MSGYSSNDPLAAFELPPEVMTYTFEHAISDHADSAHESGHEVAAALQKRLAGAAVEFAYPGVLTVRLSSGTVARCGGPGQWLVEIVQPHGEEPEVLNLSISSDETDADVIAGLIAGVVRHW